MVKKRISRAAHAPLGQAQLRAVADLFAVLSETTRLSILQHLQAGPAAVGEIVDALGMKQANVSKQLGILQQAGVVARQQDGNRAIYSIALPLVFELCGLVCGRLAEQAQQRARDLGSTQNTAASGGS
jgi:DNA-binding transcriptional ArsR family regulator